MIIKSLDNSKIVIVGGAGFVGSNLTRLLLKEKVKKIIIIDNLLSSEVENVPNEDNIDFILGSITDDKILAQIPDDIDFVFHLSTYHGNQSSMADPIADHANNTYTTLKLLERVKNIPQLKALIYSSAGCTVAKKTYDKATATTEEDPVSLYLDSPYQISKIIGEFYGNYYFMHNKVPFIKARFQNVYGPGEILGAGRWRGTPATVWRNVIPTFVWKALNKEPLPIDNGGIATRDFIYVDDIAKGLIACATKGEAGEVYNLASGVETSIKELAELINELTENNTPINLMPARTWDRSGTRYGDTSKASNKLDFNIETDLKQGLIKTIHWTKDNYNFIERCIAQHNIFIKRKV